MSKNSQKLGESNDIAIAKKDLRKQIKKQRNALGTEQRQQKSAQICDLLKFQLHKNFPNGAKILLFASSGTEVNLFPLFHALLQEKKYSCYFPKITHKDQGVFEACQIARFQDLGIQKEHFALLEPKGESFEKPQNIDVILLPAVAIDTRGYRLGQGGGFYDRFLCRTTEKCEKWAVIFSVQKVAKVPRECHDIPVNATIDETGFSSFS